MNKEREDLIMHVLFGEDSPLLDALAFIGDFVQEQGDTDRADAIRRALRELDSAGVREGFQREHLRGDRMEG